MALGFEILQFEMLRIGVMITDRMGHASPPRCIQRPSRPPPYLPHRYASSGHNGVCDKNTPREKTTLWKMSYRFPFMRAMAIQSCSRNCSPAPDLVFLKLIFSYVFFSGGMFFSQTPVSAFGRLTIRAPNHVWLHLKVWGTDRRGTLGPRPGSSP